MTRLVADASALVEYLLRTERAGPIERAITQPGAEVHVPALCDVEVLAALRCSLMTSVLDEERAAEAVVDYLDLALTRHGHRALLGRMLALRKNVSAYDAAYVALAELLEATLVTADEPLARAARRVLGPAVLGA